MGLIAFAYYGGKQRHLQEILPLLPAADHYCEPFAGSAAVLLNRAPSPIETMNDLNGDICNFFRVLRDHPADLIGRLELTPYARADFFEAWEPHSDPIESARRFFCRIVMDYAKGASRKDRSFSTNVTYERSQFSYAPWNMISKVAGLREIVDRLRMVQIENRPAIDIIRKYDRPTTLFYCDPPYLPETRTSANDYAHEMTIEQHYELAEVLNAARGLVALSGYDAPAMATMYPPGKWWKTAFKTRRVPMSSSGKLRRQEVLWTNYDPKKLNGQTAIFS